MCLLFELQLGVPQRGTVLVYDREADAMTQMNSEIEAEVHAPDTILTTLAPLDHDTRRRLLLYVQHRFGINMVEQSFSTSIESPPHVGFEASAPRTVAMA